MPELLVVIQEQEKFVPLFQLPRLPSFLESPAATGCGRNARERHHPGRRCCATVCGRKDQHRSEGGVTAGNAGCMPGEARGVGANPSACSPKGGCAVKTSVQQPGEHCKEKSKCDLIKPGISIYLDGLQSVTGFRLIVTLVRNHRVNGLSTFLSFSNFLPPTFNLGN